MHMKSNERQAQKTKQRNKYNFTETQMLNQIHNIHQRNTEDGGQTVGEELRYVQMSR